MLNFKGVNIKLDPFSNVVTDVLNKYKNRMGMQTNQIDFYNPQVTKVQEQFKEYHNSIISLLLNVFMLKDDELSK